MGFVEASAPSDWESRGDWLRPCCILCKSCSGDGNSSGPSIMKLMLRKAWSMAGSARRAFLTWAASWERSTPERIVSSRSEVASALPTRIVDSIPPSSCLCLSRLVCASTKSWRFRWLAIFRRWSEAWSYTQLLPRVAHASQGDVPEHFQKWSVGTDSPKEASKPPPLSFVVCTHRRRSRFYVALMRLTLVMVPRLQRKVEELAVSTFWSKLENGQQDLGAPEEQRITGKDQKDLRT